MEILLLGKDREDFYFQKAIDFMKQNLGDFSMILAKPGDKFPVSLMDWQGDYIISYLCPWVLPAPFLQKAKMAAINFHPGPPEYPGTGCTNFAIYDEAPVYGVTCHHMAPGVDSGKVIAVKRFKVFETDSVYSLTQRCYGFMLALFYEIMTNIISSEELPEANERWTRKPFKRSDLNAIKKIELGMSEAEIRRRIRASQYPGTHGAYIEIAGEKFQYVPPHED